MVTEEQTPNVSATDYGIIVFGGIILLNLVIPSEFPWVEIYELIEFRERFWAVVDPTPTPTPMG